MWTSRLSTPNRII